MEVVGLSSTPPQISRDRFRAVAAGCRVLRCGIAHFEPGHVAHAGEPHSHEHDEVFVVLDGRLTVPITDGPTATAGAGDWIRIAAGEEHHLTNHTDQPCTVLYMILATDEGLETR
jgi:quercetin dioxygenase-like cupin family protein